jgi:iron complex outermembrane receptor protein
MRAGDTDLKAHYLNRILVNTDGSWPTTAVTENMRAYQINNQRQSQFDTAASPTRCSGARLHLGLV